MVVKLYCQLNPRDSVQDKYRDENSFPLRRLCHALFHRRRVMQPNFVLQAPCSTNDGTSR